MGEIKDWSRVAHMIPQRSNKDCRKRYYNEVAGGLKKVYEMEQSSCSRIDLTSSCRELGRRTKTLS
jgi:Myb-like DNA-binding domain